MQIAITIHMENIKCFVKCVFNKFSERNERNEDYYPSIRMSDLGYNSVTEGSKPDGPAPLKTSTLKTTLNTQRTDDAKPNKTMDILKINNNLIQAKDCKDPAEKPMVRNNETKLPKLKIAITNDDQANENGSVINVVVNDLSKVQSPIIDRNSKKQTPSPNRPKPNMPVMGRNALLKKANIELNDSLIVHELITDKYNDVLNHYFSRMYQRRVSRLEGSEEEYSETVFSSPPSYSPLSSASSIGTSNSTSFPDEKTGFRFPNRRTSSDYGFIGSTDDANVETTVEDIERSSVRLTDAGNEKSSSASEYDPKIFLENALGEVTDFSMGSGVSKDEEMQEDNKKQDDQSVGTSDLSSLLSRATNLYSSLKKSIKRKSSTKTSTVPENPNKDENLSTTSNDSLLENLMRELSIQNEIMFQVSKALNYCRTNKEFESSTELIEAEKILIIAVCTKEALTKEIQILEDDTYERKDNSRSCGYVEIGNLRFPAKECPKTNSHTHRDFTEYFLVLLTCGSTVLASDVVVPNENGDIRIDRNFKFTNLPADFDISVCIYSMIIGNKIHHQAPKSNCPSPKKIFSYFHKDLKKYKVLSDVLHIKPSSFTLCGKCEIRSSELSKTKQRDSPAPLTLKMYNNPLSSSLSGMFSLTIKSEVKLTNYLSGFLTIGVDNEQGCTLWSRRWCILEGSSFRYWNYPSEEVTSPIGRVDLSDCVDQQVCLADRSICARPRTLMLPVRHKQSIKKYLLSADDFADIKRWQNELNCNICALSVWNCMNY